MSNSYQVIQQQKQEMNLLQREIEAEERYLHILAMSYRDTCMSKIGKENARSIAQQLNYWIDKLSNDEKKNILLLVELENSIIKFKNYIFSKYEHKPKQRNKFEKLFSDNEYCKDVMRIMIHKIYDYKLEQSLKNFENGFVSPKAHSICALNQQKKEIRSAAHEGMASAYKKLNGPVLPDSIENMMYQTFERVIDKRIEKYFSNMNQSLTGSNQKLLS